MAKRHKVQVLHMPASHRAPPVLRDAFSPSEKSRWAVTAKPVTLLHIRSGVAVNSALPARRKDYTQAERLAVAAAWDAATHLDWSAFDTLPEVTPERIEPIGFGSLKDSQRATLQAMREIAAEVLAW